MKTLAISVSTLVLLAGGASAGNLTPPAGAPSSTFKTLQEVEPRTPIQSLGSSGSAMFAIFQSGSYYLTGNIVVPSNGVGIQVSADNVTIDLNGFTIQGTTVGATASNGIFVSGTRRYLTVKNGTVRYFGGECIDAETAIGANFQDLAIFDSQGNHGIKTGNNAVVRGVRAESNNVAGILAGFGCTITDCTALNNSGDGIAAGSYATVMNCTAMDNGADGISTVQRTTVMNCAASGNNDDGIEVNFGGIVKNCTVSFNNQGIRVGAGGAALILENEASNNTNAGIMVTNGEANRIEGNHVGFNGAGINVLTSNNFIARNTARGNGNNYLANAGNEYAQIITNPGSAFVTSNAWANFAY